LEATEVGMSTSNSDVESNINEDETASDIISKEDLSPMTLNVTDFPMPKSAPTSRKGSATGAVVMSGSRRSSGNGVLTSSRKGSVLLALEEEGESPDLEDPSVFEAPPQAYQIGGRRSSIIPELKLTLDERRSSASPNQSNKQYARKAASSHGTNESGGSAKAARRAKMMRLEFNHRVRAIPEIYRRRLYILSGCFVAVLVFSVSDFLLSTEIGRYAVMIIQSARLMSLFGSRADVSQFNYWRENLIQLDDKLFFVQKTYLVPRSGLTTSINRVLIYDHIAPNKSFTANSLYYNQFEISKSVQLAAEGLLKREATTELGMVHPDIQYFQTHPPTTDLNLRYLLDNFETLGLSLKIPRRFLDLGVAETGEAAFIVTVTGQQLIIWVALAMSVSVAIFLGTTVLHPLVTRTRQVQISYLKNITLVPKKAVDDILLTLDEQLEMLSEDGSDSKVSAVVQDNDQKRDTLKSTVNYTMSLLFLGTCAVAIVIPVLMRLPLNIQYIQYWTEAVKALSYEVLIGDSTIWLPGRPEALLSDAIVQYEDIHRNALTGHGIREIQATASIDLVFWLTEDLGFNYNQSVSPLDNMDRLRFMQEMSVDIQGGLYLIDTLVLQSFLPDGNAKAQAISIAIFTMTLVAFLLIYSLNFRRMVDDRTLDMDTLVNLLYMIPIETINANPKLQRLIQTGGASILSPVDLPMIRSSYTNQVTAATADWLLLGSTFYRRTQLYSMGWGPTDLSNYMIAVCPFGGPIGKKLTKKLTMTVIVETLIRNDRKLMLLQPGGAGNVTPPSVSASASLVPTLFFYTSAGKLIHSFAWTRPRLVRMAWTESERLIACCEDGSVVIYDVFGEIVTSFSLGLGMGLGLRADGSIPELQVEGLTTSPASGSSAPGGSAKERLAVLDCRMWNSGLVAMVGPRAALRRDNGGHTTPSQLTPSTVVIQAPTTSLPSDVYHFVAVTDLTSPRPRALPTIPSPHTPSLLAPPHAWTIIPPHLSPSRTVEVLIAVSSTVYLVDPATAADQLLSQHGPFSALSVSSNGKFLALYTKNNKVWVVSTDFSKNLCLFDTRMDAPPDSIAWCGTDCVVMAWNGGGIVLEKTPTTSKSKRNAPIVASTDRQGQVVMVGPSAENVTLYYDPPTPASSVPGTATIQPGTSIHLVPEVDSVRIITSESCEILGKVPAATEAVFRIGATGPAATLYDALESFERKSPKADELVRSIRADLAFAIDTLVEAAANDFSTAAQKALLKAASFGKCFLDGDGQGTGYNAEKFVDTCRAVRVLNAVRDPNVAGMAITYGQYVRLTPEVLIDRLINRRMHLFALRACEYLAMSGERVIVHWARTKIRRAKEDEETLTRILSERLSSVSEQYPGLSYADIAKEAFRAGMSSLATQLLDFEPHSSHTVPLLLAMGSDQAALSKSVSSGDTDLVNLVLLHLRRKLPAAEFFRAVSAQPAAAKLLEVYARRQWEVGGEDAGLLKDWYYQDDRRGEGADVVVAESFREQEPAVRIPMLRAALKLYSEDKELSFEARTTEEEIRLLQIQEGLEKEFGRPFVDATVSETVYRLLVMGQASRAQKVRGDMKVGDKRFWWLKLKALVRTSNWEELEKFARTKSPIGYGPFVDECLKVNATKEAIKYVDRIEPGDLRAQYIERVRGFV
ncbi:hypothetical protein HDU93_005657, partial [Gonapodya sp. JEL0774]